MKILDAIKKGALELKNDNIEFPRLKARLLMQLILNKPLQYVIANDMKELNMEEEKEYFLSIDKLKQGSPLEHITHQREFMKLNFFVNENVLIPRQDTEILVEEVINIAKKINARKILDLCTGSGAIAVSLAKYLPQSKVVAADISKDALSIAKKNAINNDVQNQIIFINTDMFTDLKNEEFDIIVSNPPYIKTNVIEQLDEQVKKEPYIALDGGEDGLYFYKKIVNESYKYLKKDGYLCLEIGFDQKKDVIGLIENEDKFEDTYSKKDLCNNDRIVVTKLR
ncbi:MAG: peptide chain release factor N(5)-glutamine methyltransferase [Clostridia bacterium]|nr:peptide chain release factor N(5)-glutamine methyltransferase [Clostridia bacterium]